MTRRVFERPSARTLLLFTGLLAVDRITKLWALHWLAPLSEIRFLPFLRWTYAENTGIAFGGFQGANTFFVFVALALLAGLFWWRPTLEKYGAGARWGHLLVVAGALGNLYDRAVYGFVVDFIDFRVWPIFNAADSMITVGVALLAWATRKDP